MKRYTLIVALVLLVGSTTWAGGFGNNGGMFGCPSPSWTPNPGHIGMPMCPPCPKPYNSGLDVAVKTSAGSQNVVLSTDCSFGWAAQCGRTRICQTEIVSPCFPICGPVFRNGFPR